MENSARGLTLLEPDHKVVVTGEEHHQPALAGYAPRADGRSRRVAVELGFVTARGGGRVIEIRLDGRRVGQLTPLMSQRYGPLVDDVLRRGDRPGAVALVINGRRGVEVELRLPDAPTGAPAPPPGPRPPGRPPNPGPDTGRPARRRRTPYLIGGGVLALLLGVGAAVGGGDDDTAPIAAPSTPTVTAIAPTTTLAQGEPGTTTPPEPDEWMRRLGTLPLLHQPGERWMYSTGSDVLGVLVARAAARPLGDVLRERIFGPLGMRDTGFAVPAASMARFVTAYAPSDGGLVVSDDPATGAWSRPPAFPSGAGGLVSTVDDYVAFTEMLRTGGEILDPSAVREMTRDHLEPGQTDGIFLSDGEGWGLGMAVDTARGRYGWDGGLGTSWYSLGGRGNTTVTGILLTQVAWTMGPPPIRADFWAAAAG